MKEWEAIENDKKLLGINLEQLNIRINIPEWFISTSVFWERLNDIWLDFPSQIKGQTIKMNSNSAAIEHVEFSFGSTDLHVAIEEEKEREMHSYR